MQVGVFYFPTDYGIDVSELAQALETHDPAGLSITVFRAPADKAALDDYRAAGINGALLGIPDLGRDEILRLLDNYAPLAAAG